MVDLKLENDERIICRVRDGGISDGKTNDTLEGLFLTNRHLISVYERPFALFSKEKMIVDKKPLNLISVYNGKIQVETVKDDEFEVALHIFYDNGMDYLYSLGEDVPKNVYLQWEDAIKKAVIENRSNIPLKIENNNENAESTLSTTVTEIINEKNEPINDLNAVFCIKCGAKNNFEAKFCQSCGSPIQVINNPHKVEKMPDMPQEVKKASDMPQNSKITYSDRKQEFVGKILKCPACGEIIPSFTAICPACGNELNSQKVSSSLREFIDSINEYDKIIANDQELTKTGWKTWSKWIKFLWIVLNIITSFIPLVIYLVFPLVKPFLLPKNIPKLSPDEKRKSNLIENYVFPNEREAAVEAMLFTKSKVAFLASEKYNKKTLYWLNLWNTKAEQLKQRTDIILKNDTIVEAAYSEIMESKNKIYKNVKIRAFIGISIIVIFVGYIQINGSFFRGMTKIFSVFNSTSHISENENSEDDTFEWLENGLSTKIPTINAEGGTIYTNSDEKLWICLDGVPYNEFEKYINSCKEFGYTVDAVKDTHNYTAYNEEGYLLKLFGHMDSLTIELNAPQTGIIDYKWSESDFAQRIPSIEADSGSTSVDEDGKCEICLYGISDEDFKSYINLCENAGYIIDCEKKEQAYSGFDDEGYKLSVSLNDMKKMTITLEAPMIMTEINWPTVGVAKALPKPEVKVGNIVSNYDFSFTVYVGNTTIDEYNDYVDKCIKKGFDMKTYRSDTYFSAKNNKGDNLTVEYSGFNTIRISIYNYSRD